INSGLGAMAPMTVVRWDASRARSSSARAASTLFMGSGATKPGKRSGGRATLASISSWELLDLRSHLTLAPGRSSYRVRLARFTVRRQPHQFVFAPGAKPTDEEELMNWVLLVIAGLFEVGWAIGLKYTQGFTRLWPSVWTAAAIVVSMLLLGVAMRSLPAGTAYAVWTGIGTVGTIILGIALLGEPATPARLACIALILTGIVGLKLLSPE